VFAKHEKNSKLAYNQLRGDESMFHKYFPAQTPSEKKQQGTKMTVSTILTDCKKA